MESSPNRLEKLSVNEITTFVDNLISKAPVKMIVFTGGESTLLGDNLLEAISHCASKGLLTRLVTNAAWATDDLSAERMLKDLRDAGLSEINFSTDDFHAHWIPFDNIERAWNASKNKGFLSVLVATCSGPESRITPEYIQKRLGGNVRVFYNEDELEGLLSSSTHDDTEYLISSSRISRIGRGLSLPDNCFASCEDLDKSRLYGPCPNLMNPPTLNPDGSFGVCCGLNTEKNQILNLGSARVFLSRPSDDIDTFQIFMLKAIYTVGPAYLYHLATESASAVMEVKAQSVCEICERLTSDSTLLDVLKRKQDIIARQIELSETIRARTNGRNGV